jgi:hypothetical protein
MANCLSDGVHCLSDGVHYTDKAYRNLAKSIIDAALGSLSGGLTATAASNDGGSDNRYKPASFFWRGFTSPVGVRLPATDHSTGDRSCSRGGRGGRGGLDRGGGAQRRNHPYRR